MDAERHLRLSLGEAACFALVLWIGISQQACLETDKLPDANRADAAASPSDDGRPDRIMLDCLQGEPAPETDPGVRATIRGADEVFEDECDAQGNLVEYRCEEVSPPCQPTVPNCFNPQVASGEVESETIDCDGHCHQGMCAATCPQQGDPVSATSTTESSVLLTSTRDARPYRCELMSDQPGDDFECESVGADKNGFISSLGLTGSWCTGGTWGSIGVCWDGECVAEGQNCTYSCQFEWND